MDNVLELHPVAESSAGRDHGILECNARDADVEIGRGMRVSTGVRRGRHGWLPPGGLSLGELSTGSEFPAEFPAWCGAKASINTRPTECVGALMPNSDARVAARSTGSACVR